MRATNYSPAIPALLILLLLSACTDGLQIPDLKAADRIHLSFQHPEKFDLEITDSLQLEILAAMVTDEDPGALKCAYSGWIHFLKAETEIFDAEFNLHEDCRHFAIMQGDAMFTRRMTDEAWQLLRELSQKPKAEPKKSLAMLNWMLGSWAQQENKGGKSIETWTKVDERHFVARVIAISGEGADTSLLETIELVQEVEEIYYIPNVASNAGPVRFEMTGFNRDNRSVAFENQAHDFPQVIAYKMRGDTMLHARISGTQDGKFAAKDFYLTKVVRP